MSDRAGHNHTLLSDKDVITILRESGSHSFMQADRVGTGHLAKCNMVPAVRMAYAKGLGEAHHDQAAYDALVEKLMANMGESWESSEGSAESILVEYVRTLELRVAQLGGHTKAHDGGVHAAYGAFTKAAEKYVTTDNAGDWDDMAIAWEEYDRVKEAAE